MENLLPIGQKVYYMDWGKGLQEGYVEQCTITAKGYCYNILSIDPLKDIDENDERESWRMGTRVYEVTILAPSKEELLDMITKEINK